MPKISFISANFVARALNYTGNAKSDWGTFDKATRAQASADEFMRIAMEVSEAGFDAIDIWDAHCDWRKVGHEDDIEQIKGACSQFDLAITSYAGGLGAGDMQNVEKLFKFMKQLGTNLYAGGVWGADLPAVWPGVDEVCARLGMRFAFENHPEKSITEMLGKIDDGKWKNVGIALDTGWCGTQGVDPVEAAKVLGDKLFIVHLKDVKAAGAHETCALGDGIVPIEAVVKYLTQSKWPGTFCIEHEPFDRDPMPEIIESVKRVRQWMR
ncbi:MAG TPA: sugar phosphate isomerase/epimerase family protein [Tepidisphaeraceae bacterium]|jgi:sugar phosphate isomerase/epimerase|nr:sugar phosphate isomerase/epimerase family protein [Tepidisphaeraceae bacterium]